MWKFLKHILHYVNLILFLNICLGMILFVNLLKEKSAQHIKLTNYSIQIQLVCIVQKEIQTT